MSETTTAPDPSQQNVLDALTRLGETTEDVYRTLAAGGYAGVRKYADMCPVANYLRSTLGTEYQYSVFTSTIVSDEHSREPYAVVKTPDPVYSFVLRFDDGQYADLVLKAGSPQNGT